jgi:hypothetical protein
VTPGARRAGGWAAAIGAGIAIVAVKVASSKAYVWGTDDPASYYDRILEAIQVGVGSVAALELIAAVAGRGRPMPGARFACAFRVLLGAAALAYNTDWSVRGMLDFGYPGSPLPLVATFGGIGAAILAACAVGGRAGGPSGIAIGLFGACIQQAEFFHSSLPGVAAMEAVRASSMLLVLGALRRLRLDRTRLARAGVTPWAPGDLAIVPVQLAWIATFAVVIPFSEGGLRWYHVEAPVTLAFALLTLAGLRRLDRDLRAAESRAAARATARAST